MSDYEAQVQNLLIIQDPVRLKPAMLYVANAVLRQEIPQTLASVFWFSSKGEWSERHRLAYEAIKATGGTRSEMIVAARALARVA